MEITHSIQECSHGGVVFESTDHNGDKCVESDFHLIRTPSTNLCVFSISETETLHSNSDSTVMEFLYRLVGLGE